MSPSCMKSMSTTGISIRPNELKTLIIFICIMGKRLLSFDFMRGFAIICIVIFHLLLLTCNIVPQAESNPFSLPTSLLVVAILTVILAHWRGMFLIISSVVQIYTMTVAIRNGADRKKLWKSQVSFGILLWVFGMFREVFLNEWSIPAAVAGGSSFTTAIATYWTWIYLMEALEDIAWSIILTSTIFYFLTANNGVEKITRNAIIFLVLALVVIFLSPLVNQAATAIYHQDTANTSPEQLIFYGWWDYVTRIFIYPFIEYNSPLFPMLGYTFFGVVFGLLLPRPVIPKHFLRNNGLVGLGMIVFGLVWLFFVQGIPSDIGQLITFECHPIWFVFLATGMQLLVLGALLRLIEFNPKINLERTLKVTYFGRRWGVTALTVYSCLAFEYLIRALMNMIFPQYNWLQFFGLPIEWSVFLIVVDLAAWFAILRLWEKGKFKYSLEWIFTKIAKRNKPGKVVNANDVLDVHGVLEEPEALLFVQPIKEQKVKYTVL